MPIYKKLPALALFVVFIVSIVLAFFVATHRHKALIKGNIEYSNYLEFTARAFDSSLAPIISINSFSSGANMFFRGGPDGAPDMWKWIHFEPIKIIPAFIYSLDHSILASFCFYIGMFFLPLLYGAFLLWKQSGNGVLISLALISLAVYPSSFLYATLELHPYFILPPLFICFVLSLLYRRSLFEKTTLLTFLLLAREEALIFSAAALIWELFRNRRDGTHQRETVILSCIWAGWLVVTAIYEFNTPYGFYPPLPSIVLFPALSVVIFAFVTFLWWLWRKGTYLWSFVPNALFGLLALTPTLTSLVILEGYRPPLRLIYGRYGFTFFYLFIAFLMLYMYENRWTRLQKGVVIGALSLCIGLFAASELIPHPSATREYVARWVAGAQDDALVYRAATSIPKDTPVLLDTTTMPAFYAHDNTYAYNYLPYYLFSTQGNTSEFPQNLPQLKKLISTQEIPYAVLFNSDAPPLLSLLREAGKELTLIEQNSKFSFYRIK